MTAEVLVTGATSPYLEAALAERYRAHRLPSADRAEFLAQVGPRVRAVVTGGVFGLAADLAEALPALELVVVHGVGVDAIDLDAMRARGVKVATTPDVLTEDVADLAIALWLA